MHDAYLNGWDPALSKGALNAKQYRLAAHSVHCSVHHGAGDPVLQTGMKQISYLA